MIYVYTQHIQYICLTGSRSRSPRRLGAWWDDDEAAVFQNGGNSPVKNAVFMGFYSDLMGFYGDVYGMCMVIQWNSMVIQWNSMVMFMEFVWCFFWNSMMILMVE